MFAVLCSTPAPGNDQDSYDVDNRFAESPIAPWREGWTVGFVWHGVALSSVFCLEAALIEGFHRKAINIKVFLVVIYRRYNLQFI